MLLKWGIFLTSLSLALSDSGNFANKSWKPWANYTTTKKRYRHVHNHYFNLIADSCRSSLEISRDVFASK
jgi:hypothetical protein